MEMAIKKNKVLQKAKLQLSYLTGEEEARRLEELEEKWEMDRNSAIGYAEEKGEKRGKIAGKKEKQIEIAKEMLKKNMEIKLISEITKLTIQEIEQIKDSNAK